MPTLRHLHTLRKIRGTKGKSSSFMCNHPECMWKSPSHLMEGKKFQCNFCEQDFLFMPSMKNIRFPHCIDCTTQKKAGKKVKVELQYDILQDLGLIQKEDEDAPSN